MWLDITKLFHGRDSTHGGLLLHYRVLGGELHLYRPSWEWWLISIPILYRLVYHLHPPLIKSVYERSSLMLSSFELMAGCPPSSYNSTAQTTWRFVSTSIPPFYETRNHSSNFYILFLCFCIWHDQVPAWMVISIAVMKVSIVKIQNTRIKHAVSAVGGWLSLHPLA